MNFKKNYFIIFLFFMVLFNCLKVYSQSYTYIISATNMANGSPIISSSIDFQSALKCIDIKTGITILSNNSNNGEFLINCKVDYKFNSLGINLYPNPVVNTTIIKFITPPPFEEIFKITFWTLDGILIKTKNELGINIFKGVVFNLNDLTSGTYIIRIESPKFMDALKFIKVN